MKSQQHYEIVMSQGKHKRKIVVNMEAGTQPKRGDQINIAGQNCWYVESCNPCEPPIVAMPANIKKTR